MNAALGALARPEWVDYPLEIEASPSKNEVMLADGAAGRYCKERLPHD